MKLYRLEPTARADLANISVFIAKDSVSAAERLLDRFHDAFRFLVANPLSVEKRIDLGADLRQFTLGNYVILFRPHTAGVSIANVIHGARDVGALFRKQKDEGDSR
jgi:toxin ParE1/3/4